MATDLSLLNDYQLQMMLQNAENDGKHAKAMLQAGNEKYRTRYVDLREKWKAIKGEMNRRTSSAAAPVAPQSAAPASISPKQFHQMCAQHDWNHEYSDDAGAYRAGKASEAKLQDAIHAQPELAPIYKAWKAHVVTGAPRPVEPA